MADIEKVIKEAEKELEFLAPDDKHRLHMGIMMKLGWIYDVLELLKEQEEDKPKGSHMYFKQCHAFILKGKDGLCTGGESACDECPCFRNYLVKCENEQEKSPVKPITASDHDSPEETLWYVCPACRIAIDYKDRFCRHCGRQMLWE